MLIIFNLLSNGNEIRGFLSLGFCIYDLLFITYLLSVPYLPNNNIVSGLYRSNNLVHSRREGEVNGNNANDYQMEW